MARTLKIACLQSRPQVDFQSALTEALTLAEEAVGVGAQLLALPEYCGGLQTRDAAFVPPHAYEDSHPVLLGLQQFAKEKSVWMLIGSVAVSAGNGLIVNRSFVVDKDGNIRARYDKLHLFDIQLSEGKTYQESRNVTAGDRAVIVDAVCAKMGLSICYDLRFPSLYRELSQAGAEILTVPAAFTKTTGKAHWHVLNRARAIENGAFVIAPCAVGKVPGGGESYGHSLILNPWGEVLADGGSNAGIVHAKIDLDEVNAARTRIPSLEHDRQYVLSDGNDRVIA